MQQAPRMRKICVLSGKRGGYGAMKPMLRRLRDDPELALQLVLTDQHVSEKFGRTIAEVQREFEVAAAVDMEQQGDAPADRARALGVCLERMSDVLHRLAPDICVLYGDRGEVLVTALAAATLRIPIAHLQGGDVSGSVDDLMRHSITKLAHLHFVSNAESALRVERMGEARATIFQVGDSHLDLIKAREFLAPAEVALRLGLRPGEPVVVVLQHSETTAPGEAYAQMRETLLAVSDIGHRAIVIHPCSDVGYGGVLRAIDELATGEQFSVHVNLDAEVFWGLLDVAAVLVGNSSAGIVETASFGLPAVNVGRRQEGRLCAENVLHVPHERGAIRAALEKALEDGAFKARVQACANPYGDGRAGERIVDVLKGVKLGPELFVKRMTY
jgi:UDP-hydrolysing UDP-N-acetyl-D-glucosamine 2-epimerase